MPQTCSVRLAEKANAPLTLVLTSHNLPQGFRNSRLTMLLNKAPCEEETESERLEESSLSHQLGATKVSKSQPQK